MSKHTPAPWQYSFEGGTVAFIVEADGTTIGKISTTEGSTANRSLPSNARLIASAPELLEALKAFVNVCDNGNPMEFIKEIGALVEPARKVIAKAEGV